MTRRRSDEDELEQLAKETLAELSWTPLNGPDIAPGTGLRESWDDLVMPSVLYDALQRFNPTVPTHYLQQALSEITAAKSQDPVAENFRVHGWLASRFRQITYIDDDGRDNTPEIVLLHPDSDRNTWHVVNQVTLRNRYHERRLDMVLYCNGMPVVVVELKSATDRGATIRGGHAQLATYLDEFPLAFRFHVLTVIADGISAEYGTAFTQFNHFSPWNVDDDGEPDRDPSVLPLELLLHGLGNQQRFVDLTINFTAFDLDGTRLTKRIAKPHQYFAVRKALNSTVHASRSTGKAGVVWHTQGSGKSMEMELYANLVLRSAVLANPTIVVITDRRELDGQLFRGFDQSQLLPEDPIAVKTRTQLRTALTEHRSGGILFTTLQKFGQSKDERDSGFSHPQLSDRRNIVVIVDEAHRSHYDDLNGYARHLKDALPNATLIAFTGTPISRTDRNTREVFGEYIDIYDLSRAVEDKATVPVYFEARIVTVELPETVDLNDLDVEADEITLGLDDVDRVQLQAKVTQLNKIYGAPARLEQLAADIVDHWDRRRSAMSPLIGGPGKAMVVCSTRDICARLYEQIIRLRPDWHSDDLTKGRIKVVYSGNATDAASIRKHVRPETENDTIKARLKKPDDELEIVLVQNMLLTGYDSPPLHTIYLDRPIQGALLMQTLARANRTFNEKDAGLLVGYAPVLENLRTALAEYTKNDQTKEPVGKEVDKAEELVREILARLATLTNDISWRPFRDGQERAAWIRAIYGVADYLRAPEPGRGEDEPTRLDQFRRDSAALAKAWSICTGAVTDEALRREIDFYDHVRTVLAKQDADRRRAEGEPIPEDIALLLSSLVAKATESDEVRDIYAEAGLDRPSLATFTPEMLAKFQASPTPHLTVEALRALILEEARKANPGNALRQRSFSERVAEVMRKYTNTQLTSAEVMYALFELSQEVRADSGRGQRFSPPLSEDELAFYDAVADNESAVKVMGDEKLAAIARDLIRIMQRDVRTDWTVREDVKAKLRSSVKRLLRLHGYPPDRSDAALALVLEQMEHLAPRFAKP